MQYIMSGPTGYLTADGTDLSTIFMPIGGGVILFKQFYIYLFYLQYHIKFGC